LNKKHPNYEHQYASDPYDYSPKSSSRFNQYTLQLLAMTSLILQYPRDDAKILIKASLERTSGIKHYYDDGHRIIAKSGMSIGSYGEKSS
jgi:hypothetical protein